MEQNKGSLESATPWKNTLIFFKGLIDVKNRKIKRD